MTIKDELCPRIKADAKLMGDGTLWIKTDKLDNVGRVLVEHGTRCKQFYQDAQPEQPSFSYGHEDDLISRQAVIDAILAVTNFNNVREMLDYVLENNLTNDWIGGVIDSIDAVIEVDSAQPEPKRGKWILDRSGAYCCSECMEPCAGYVMMKPRDKFCKMCGSRNEVTE